MVWVFLYDCGLADAVLSHFSLKKVFHKGHKQMVFLQCGYADGFSSYFWPRSVYHNVHKQMVFLQCGYADGVPACT